MYEIVQCVCDKCTDEEEYDAQEDYEYDFVSIECRFGYHRFGYMSIGIISSMDTTVGIYCNIDVSIDGAIYVAIQIA